MTVRHFMIPGSHERGGGAECYCGKDWNRWADSCVSQLCTRESATPAHLDNPDDPQPHTLIVDCSVHGEIGRIPYGEREYEQMEALFAEHVRTVATTEETP